MLNFDIKCISKEDGSESIITSMEDKIKIVQKLKDCYTLRSGEIAELLALGNRMQTLFYVYVRV